ncbi:MAG TPA: SusC/RagA family TonB-linked outer membrane protein [Fermentimonas sp.]|nr:SusC/RagA family TonB-linked outer membrane protein [Fermentimonas sp.]
MRSKFTWVLTLFLVFFVQIGFAQQKQVTGVVRTEFGDPIPGASVLRVGTNEGTDTDVEGSYSLNVQKGDRIRVIFGGFKTVTVSVSDADVLNVVMVEEDPIDMDVMVLDAYRTTAKPKSNVAATTVTSETIENRPNASFVQTLQGQVPGLNISTGSGQPGSSNTMVLLRGIGSINGNVEPLYVIDGVPMSTANFRSINQNDIESVNVLKDAGATSIYGNRGANGVIVVTTKRASFDQSMQVKYVGNVGVSSLQKHRYDLMDGHELMLFENQTEKNNVRWTASELRNARNTDWLDVFFRDAITQSHTLSFASGSKNMSQFTSIGYNSTEGTLKNTDMKRFNLRSNISGRSANNRLTYNTNLTANFSKNNEAVNLGTGAVNYNPVLGALRGVPYFYPEQYDPNNAWGSLVQDPDTGVLGVYGHLNNRNLVKMSPLLILDQMNHFRNVSDEVKIIASGGLNYDLGSGFSAGTNLGVDYTEIQSSRWESFYAWNSFYFAEDDQEYMGFESDSRSRRASFTSTTNLKWSKMFNEKHELSAGAYVEYLKAHFNSAALTQNGLHPYFSGPGWGTGWVGDTQDNDYYVPNASKSVAEAGLFSYFGTLDYDYNTKYGIGLTARRDASFRFAEHNRWGTFWSVSARWNIDREDFMENSAFNELKLRGSYGTAGNQDIVSTGLFGAAALYSEQYAFAGISYADNPSIYISNIPNPNLQWETIEQANIGLDFGVWSNRLRGSVDVYQKTTKDLYQSRPMSAIHGASSISDNIGSMRNRGVELILHGDIVRNDNLKITLNANGSYNKNEFLELAGADEDGVVWSGGLTTMREGDPYGQFYLVKYAGINPDNGNLLFFDKDGNKVERFVDADRQFTGKSYIPKYQGGFGLDIDYKGWFLSSSFTFVQDIWRFDYDYSTLTHPDNIGDWNMSRDMYDYWTPTNRDATMPGMNADNLPYQNFSDKNIRDASYVRLRYVSLGYNFKQSDLNFMKLSGLRVYAQAENLVTWTKWKGWDAESSRGSDQSQYPTPRTVSFGVEVQF